MRILYVVEAMGGGIFTYIVEMANALCKGNDVYIAYNTRPQTPKNYETYFDNRVHLIQIKSFCRSINFIKDFKAGKDLYEVAKNIKPDIIHLHSSKAGIIGRFVFAFYDNAKLFYTPHGYSFLMQDYSKVKRVFFRNLEKIFAIKKCKTISCGLGEHLETLKLTDNATYVNNGIDVEEISSICFDIKPSKHKELTVFTSGRICAQKNPTFFNEIALKCPNINFIWIGDGELKDLLNAPNISITGWCKREEALRISLAADIFVLTSLWEGLPMSLIEAMYMKKVCIVTDVIGNRDVIRNNQNGFICKNVDEFAYTIHKIINMNTQDITETAYKEVLNEYNIDYMIKKYIEIYKG